MSNDRDKSKTLSRSDNWARLAPLAWVAALSGQPLGCQPAQAPTAGSSQLGDAAPRYAPEGVEMASLPPSTAAPTVMPGGPPSAAGHGDAAAAKLLSDEPSSQPSTAGGLRVLPGGVGVEDVVLGDGPEIKAGRRVSVHYVGHLEDGSVFDSSRKRGVPFRYEFGSGMVIKGWAEGMVGMRVGGTRRLLIPPHKAYGERGAGSAIPPNAILEFEIELLEML